MHGNGQPDVQNVGIVGTAAPAAKLQAGKQRAFAPCGQQKKKKHNALCQHGGNGGPGHPQSRQRPQAENEQGVQHDVGGKARSGGAEGDCAGSHAGEQPGEYLVEERKEQSQRHHKQIAFGIAHHAGVVQAEKGRKRLVENEIYCCARPGQHGPQAEGCCGIGRGLFRVPAAQRVRGFYLPAQPRNGSQPVGQPQIHARSPHGGHGAAAHAAYPYHVREVIRHLDELGGHDGKGQLCQRGQDAPVKEIYFLHAVSHILSDCGKP